MRPANHFASTYRRRKATMDLSIVIASYNTREITKRCLTSVLSQTAGLEYEIIVVDNASSDDSAQMIEREFPAVKLICSRENLGFGTAQNIGLCQARGKYFLVLNSDAVFVGNAAKILVDRLRSGPSDLGVVGPQILNADRTVAASARRALHARPMIVLGILNRHFVIKRLLPPEPLLRKYLGFVLARWHDNYVRHDVIREVDFVDGMCALMKREVLEEVGLFDEQFFFDREMEDLANRTRGRGWRIEFYPRAQVIHLAHASRKKFPRIIVETHRSDLIYYAKYAPDLVPLVRQAVLCVVSLKLLLLRFGTLLAGHKEQWREARHLCGEIIRFYRQFQPSSVKANERIRSLPSREGTSGSPPRS
jgi:GT2 family glycosyltransferase